VAKKLAVAAVVLILLAQGAVFGATINVPSFEVLTRGYVQNGLFGFVSRGSLELKIEGGVKFGGRLTLGYDTTSLENAANIENAVGVVFKSAGIELRQPFGLPLNADFFVGQDDVFCSGDAFPELFGSASIATRYRGFFYFPDSIIYDGIHSVKGTGFSVHVPVGSERFQAALYVYQDMRFTTTAAGVASFFPGHYSVDVRSLLNYEHLKIEAFAGATIPVPGAPYGAYRGGLLFYAGESNVEFMAQLGIPRFAPGADNISINLFYLLFEPRVNLGVLHIIPTFFWHPQYYLQTETGELGSFDVNLNFLFAGAKHPEVTGGVEANLVFSSQASAGTQKLDVTVSPYASLLTPGVQWDLKVNANLFPFDLTSLVDVFLGIRAVF
jgi:hypothetical protein